MIKYTVIIPTFNRAQNLACCLMALIMQTYSSEFWEVIVTDESTFLPWQVIQDYQGRLNLKFLWQKQTTGNPGPAKNWAAKNAQGEALIFLDADVILNERALEAYNKLHSQYPKAIICGRYDWLMPMRVIPQDVAGRFDKVVSNELPILHQPGPGPIPGVDPRWQDEKVYQMGQPVNTFSLAMFGGNVLMPLDIFEKSGGFDPSIKGHGGEDNELGWTMEEIGAKALFTEEAIGWHLWHPRNQKENERAVRRNIEYIDSKHNIENGVRKFPLQPGKHYGQELLDYLEQKDNET